MFFLNFHTEEEIKKYPYHDEPHAFETSMDYLVLASNNSSLSENVNPPSSNATSSDHIYSNSHFKFEVLETTV